MVKNLPAMQETQVWSLGQEDPLEEEMVTHSSILAWRIPWTEKPGGLQSRGSQRVRHDWETNTFTNFFFLNSNCVGVSNYFWGNDHQAKKKLSIKLKEQLTYNMYVMNSQQRILKELSICRKPLFCTKNPYTGRFMDKNSQRICPLITILFPWALQQCTQAKSYVLLSSRHRL